LEFENLIKSITFAKPEVSNPLKNNEILKPDSTSGGQPSFRK
jgi:hypothetical protein